MAVWDDDDEVLDEDEEPESEGLMRHTVESAFSMLFGCMYCNFAMAIEVVLFFIFLADPDGEFVVESTSTSFLEP